MNCGLENNYAIIPECLHFSGKPKRSSILEGGIRALMLVVIDVLKSATQAPPSQKFWDLNSSR